MRRGTMSPVENKPDSEIRGGRSMCRWIFVVILPSILTAGMLAQQSAAPTSPSSDAPGRGVLPDISAHTSALPSVYDLDRQPIEQISPLIQRQYLTGAQSTLVKWTVKKGAVFPLHHHVNEQTTWITKGRCEVYSQGKRYVLVAGSVMIIPANVPHEFLCTEDSIDIDFFAPQRQDWLDGAKSVAAGPLSK